MRRIASRQNPIVARYRQTARDADALLLDGPHLVGDALAAGVRVTDAAITIEGAGRDEIRRLAERLEQAGADVVAVTAPVMAALSPVRSSSVIVARADLPTRYADVFGRSGRDPLVLVAVGIQDPGNMGAIVRVAEAAGATGVVVAGASANPYGWKALRGSMGSAIRLPIATIDASALLPELRRHRCRLVAAAPRGGLPLYEADLEGPIAILIGGEGAGLPAELLAHADMRLSIPMEAPVESLNTAVSAALLAYEARRQRARIGRTVAS